MSLFAWLFELKREVFIFSLFPIVVIIVIIAAEGVLVGKEKNMFFWVFFY